MSNENTGGQAFPCAAFAGEGVYPLVNDGMTLRDYFAAKAMPMVMAQPFIIHISSQQGASEYAHEVAGECYAIADAMLAARVEVANSGAPKEATK